MTHADKLQSCTYHFRVSRNEKLIPEYDSDKSYVRDRAWFVHLYEEIILELERGIVDHTGTQTLS